jgi:uncharacterized protein (TIGR02588 family)
MSDARSATAGTAHRTRRAMTAPLLEWIAGGVGLALVLAVFAYLGARAVSDGQEPPALTAHVERITPYAGGYVVEVLVRNGSRATAAEVELEATLYEEAREVRRSTALVPYVPGRSGARAGFVFDVNPARYRLEVRAVGYAEP